MMEWFILSEFCIEKKFTDPFRKPMIFRPINPVFATIFASYRVGAIRSIALKINKLQQETRFLRQKRNRVSVVNIRVNGGSTIKNPVFGAKKEGKKETRFLL